MDMQNKSDAKRNDVDTKPSIFAFDYQDLATLCRNWGLPSYRLDQVTDWFFNRRVFSLDEMTNLPKALREKLAQEFSWELPQVVEQVDCEDGATKLLVKNAKGLIFESVVLRYNNRVSLCVSSQVGCKMACSFCQTGKLGFLRNLTTEEILGQFVQAQRLVAKEGLNISHVVFMGMGEPFDNFEAVVKAANILVDEKGFGISRRRITVSTSGISPKIRDFAERSKASLAISLHACRDELRDELMPINRKYDLESLKESLLHYQKVSGEKITIEYILIRDKNCGRREAKELVRFLHGLKAKVNLIPFNAHPGLPYERPEESDIREFQQYLSDRGYPAPVRYSKGLEVSAACGQLAAKHKDMLDAIPSRKSAIATAP